jgi:amino acid transporter
VFGEFNNETGIQSTLYVALIGMLFVSFSFSGYEGGATLAEETKNASVSAPKGIILTIIVSSIVGYIYLLGLLFAMQSNIQFVLSESTSTNVVSNVFYLAFTHSSIDSSDSLTTSTNMTAVHLLNYSLCLTLFFSGFSSFTLTTRIAFAMARDGAIPKSSFFKDV